MECRFPGCLKRLLLLALMFPVIAGLTPGCGGTDGEGRTEDGGVGDAPAADGDLPDAAPEPPLVVDGFVRHSLGDRERDEFDGFHWSVPEEQFGAAAVRLTPTHYPFAVHKVVYDLVDGDYVESKGVDCDPTLPHAVRVAVVSGASPPTEFSESYDIAPDDPAAYVPVAARTLTDRNEKRTVSATRFSVTLAEPIRLEEGQDLVIALFLGVGDLVSSCPTWDYGTEAERERNYINATEPVEWVTKRDYDDAHFLPTTDKDLTFEMRGLDQ